MRSKANTTSFAPVCAGKPPAPSPCRPRFSVFALLTAFAGLALLNVGGPTAARADTQGEVTTMVGFGTKPESGQTMMHGWSPATVWVNPKGYSGEARIQVSVEHGKFHNTTSRTVQLVGAKITPQRLVVEIGSVNGSYDGEPLFVTTQVLAKGRLLAYKREMTLSGLANSTPTVLVFAARPNEMHWLRNYQMPLSSRHNPNVTSSRLQILHTMPEAAPAFAQGYDAIDTVVIGDTSPAKWEPEQQQALKNFVVHGGRLIVSNYDNWSSLAFLHDILPVRPVDCNTGGRDARYFTEVLQQRYGTGPELPAAPFAIRERRLQPNATVLLGESNHPLLTARPCGTGTVICSAFDLFHPALREEWNMSPSFWNDLLRVGRNEVSPLARVAAPSAQSGSYITNRLSDALAGKKAASAPATETLFVFLTLYLVLLIPVSYFLLKKFDRREWAWFTAPILVLVFTGVSYAIGTSIKSGDLTLNRAVVLETSANQKEAAGFGLFSLYSPKRASYDVNFGTDSFGGYVPSDALKAWGKPSELNIEQEQASKPSLLKDVGVRIWDKRSFSLPFTANLKGDFDAQITTHEGNGKAGSGLLTVTVTNRTVYTVHDAYLLFGNDSVPLGDFAPGQKWKQTIRINASQNPSTHFRLLAGNGYPGTYGGGFYPQMTGSVAIRQGMVDILNQDVYYEEATNGYTKGNAVPGKIAIAGWVKDFPMPVQVNGKEAAGDQATLLYVHLPMPKGYASAVNWNPFLTNANRNIPAFEREIPAGNGNGEGNTP